jgi:hypothetical protein
MADAAHTTLDTTMAAVGSKATYTGAGTSIFGWLTANEFAVLIGVAVAIGGFVVNWYYRHKEDRRQQAEHDRRMGMYE